MSTIDFNEYEYLAANPDVAIAVQNGQFKSGREHYDTFGKWEGRTLTSERMTRQDKALYALDKKGLGLEIGPSHNPIAPKKHGFNVHILDHLNADDLRKKYADHTQYGVRIDNIEEVDFVWNGQPLSALIGKKSCYDWIIASHVIEHIPDIVTFFQQCEILLKPTGRLSLIVPDKRYCFDYFNPTSSTGELLDAFADKRTRPSAGKVFDHFANATKHGGQIAWDTVPRGGFELIHSFEQARSLWQQAQDGQDYIDTHCWRFTLESFHLVLADLNMLRLTDLTIVKEFVTTGCEFYVTLGQNFGLSSFDRLEMLKRRKLEDV